LTDGQQRLTTIYLLIGMLHKQLQNKPEVKQDVKDLLRQCLISDFERKDDDREPYLQYAIRESSVFFIRDLVNEFFINGGNKKVADIINQPWYFNDYKLDPTICSIIKALGKIENALTDKALDIVKFADFVVNKVKVQYFNVGDRKHGEERFVIVNTTGRSLTISENVKPILLGKLSEEKYSEQWEDRETWFWQNKNKKENTADDGVKEFLTWCLQIIEKQDSVDLFKKAKEYYKEDYSEVKIPKILDNIQAIFVALQHSVELLKLDKFKTQFKFINSGEEVNGIVGIRSLAEHRRHNILLPLLGFMVKFPNANKEDIYQFIRRLRKNYFDNQLSERTGNYVDWRHILQMIEKCDKPLDVLMYAGIVDDFRVITNVTCNLKNWFNSEEQLKYDLKKSDRAKVEEWEDHPDFMGDLSFLFSIHANANENKIAILEKYYQSYQNTVDLVRSKIKDKPLLSNYFRLFRLYAGCNKVGHISYTSGMEGVRFSTINREHLKKDEFKKLLEYDENEMINYCKNYIKSKISEQNILNVDKEGNYTVENFIKCWMTLKVFNAEMVFKEGDHPIQFWDGNETGVAAYYDKDKNTAIKNLPFSLENSYCGFAVKSGGGGGNYISYVTNQKEWLLKPFVINTPFAGFEDGKSDEEKIKENKKRIYQIIDFINSGVNPL